MCPVEVSMSFLACFKFAGAISLFDNFSLVSFFEFVQLVLTVCKELFTFLIAVMSSWANSKIEHSTFIS